MGESSDRAMRRVTELSSAIKTLKNAPRVHLSWPSLILAVRFAFPALRRLARFLTGSHACPGLPILVLPRRMAEQRNYSLILSAYARRGQLPWHPPLSQHHEDLSAYPEDPPGTVLPALPATRRPLPRMQEPTRRR